MTVIISIVIIFVIVIVFYNLYSELEREYFLKCSREKFLIKEKETLEDEVKSLNQYIKYVKQNPEKLNYS